MPKWQRNLRLILNAFIIRPLSPQELSGRYLADALWVFGDALGFPRRSARVLNFSDTLGRHAGYAGYMAFGAFNVRQKLVGFSYGYTSQPGLWWRDQVAACMTSEQRATWFADTFELAELHVHPSAQGRHVGGQLHDRLIASQPHQAALLSVMHRSVRARQLYAARGWQVLIDDLRFSSEPQTPFSVLGLWR